MQTSAGRDLMVGLFVLAGLLAIAYLSIQVGGLSYKGPGGLRLVASLDEIGGLSVRAPVVIAGVKNPFCRRYRLTNRRVIVEQPFGGDEVQSVSLDRYDAVDVEVEPGQEWYPAGNLIFRLGDVETFRLVGVPHPQAFAQTCLKAHAGYAGVLQARQTGAAV